MRLFKVLPRNPGDKKTISKEELIEELRFHKHKFNNRKIPKNKDDILFITCFSEFGCESIGLMYCIPKIIEQNSDKYVICVGWYGRQYLYKHLADEYWELAEEFQYLRDNAQAFAHSSRNIASLEKQLLLLGKLFTTEQMGYIFVGNLCKDCKHFYGSEDENVICEKCGSKNVKPSILANLAHYKKFAVPIPQPSRNAKSLVKKYLKPNPVGIFARNRLTYGRNLSPDFYVKLITILEDMGYNPIWLGEKQSVMPCPVPHILDFSRMPESRNLELTLAIISHLKFTIQFWTASTRFASMLNVPWILFETPDQIVGKGQEGKRIALTTEHDRKKIVYAQYLTAVENPDRALAFAQQAIKEIDQNNWNDIIGIVEHPEIVRAMVQKQQLWRKET